MKPDLLNENKPISPRKGEIGLNLHTYNKLCPDFGNGAQNVRGTFVMRRPERSGDRGLIMRRSLSLVWSVPCQKTYTVVWSG